MQIKTSETDFIEVRVMVVKNSSISNTFFRDKKNSAQAIKGRKASYSPSGMISSNKVTKVDDAFPCECTFSYKLSQAKILTSIKDVLKHDDGTFNVKGRLVFSGEVKSPEKCKQSVKDALLTDSTGTIPLSVWEEHFGSLLNGSFLQTIKFKTRYFNGKTLTTLPVTDIKEIDAFEPQAVVVENCENKTVCCPAILNGMVNIYPTCNNNVKKSFLHLLVQ